MDENQKSWDLVTFENFAKKSVQIIPKFKYLYLFIIIYIFAGTHSIVSGNNLAVYFQLSGKKFGQLALILLGTVVTPGILGRFGVEIKLTIIITLFRRQLGITVFLLAFTHYFFVRLLPRLQGQIPWKPPYPIFELMGMSAFFILFLMFLTSNNFSKKKLGRWWKILHRFVYLAIWLLVFHTGLQRISIWTFFIFTFAVLEVVSWIYYWNLKKKAI